VTAGTRFRIGEVDIGLDAPLFLMAGPCVIENERLCLEIAERLVGIGKRTGVATIFKASFDKANRSSISSFRGLGLKEGMRILARVREATGLPVMTDVHEPSQAAKAAETVDCLQVPAFLCRQTDLLVACAETGRPTSIKKGQFVSPGEMANVVEKMRTSGNGKVILTERGTFFGYNRLVNDMTGILTMQQLGCPVVFDATHSTQQPGGLGAASGGRREMGPLLARAAVAARANGLFLEVHPDPEKALSDAASMLPLDRLEGLVRECRAIFEVVHGR
jgi:2-dehydro-3-deoxyphosphooctonate aldolase (KDO 8-P synthase)